ncbi:MAG: hypothetical protein JWN40_4180 [Phycisphaerales bacterium]|nr:hypothetical protein [Phycisphaerales bacterium]
MIAAEDPGRRFGRRAPFALPRRAEEETKEVLAPVAVEVLCQFDRLAANECAAGVDRGDEGL